MEVDFWTEFEMERERSAMRCFLMRLRGNELSMCQQSANKSHRQLSSEVLEHLVFSNPR
jgi:hypothetical protein